MWEPIVSQMQCLAGAIGVEGSNPTCLAMGLPDNWLLQLLSWPVIVGLAGVLLGIPLAIFAIRKLLELLGVVE